jgi:hypothetical protein
MAYFLSSSGIHEIETGCSIIDDPRAEPMFEMEYDVHGGVDYHARQGTVQMSHGYPVKAETAPKKLLWSGGKLALPEVMVLASVFIVCDRFRTLVETFEPSTHQFIPVEIYRSRKGPMIAQYYWFNICKRLYSVDPNRTTFFRMPSHEGSYVWVEMRRANNDYVRIPNAKLVFSTQRIGNNHIWHDVELMGRHFLTSNTFGNAAIERKFTGLRATEFEEAN